MDIPHTASTSDMDYRPSQANWDSSLPPDLPAVKKTKKKSIPWPLQLNPDDQFSVVSFPAICIFIHQGSYSPSPYFFLPLYFSHPLYICPSPFYLNIFSSPSHYIPKY